MNKTKKHTLRAERNMVCALCAFVFLLFAGAALAGWLAAPFPVGAVLTGVAAFVLVFTGILSIGWVKYARRFYAAAKSAAYPAALLGENLSVTFYAADAEKVAAYLRESAAVPPLPARHTREQWLERSQRMKEIREKTLGGCTSTGYPALSPADLAQIAGKTILMRTETHETLRAFLNNSVFGAANRLTAVDAGRQT